MSCYATFGSSNEVILKSRCNCGRNWDEVITREQWDELRTGIVLVQDIFPDMDPGLREFLFVSGNESFGCPLCWLEVEIRNVDDEEAQYDDTCWDIDTWSTLKDLKEERARIEAEIADWKKQRGEE